MKVAVLLIATGGAQYERYAENLIASLKKFFPPHDVVLFTDSALEFDAIKIHQPNLGWPRATLMRYHAMLAQKELLSHYDQLFYLDIDMVVCSHVTPSDIFSGGLTVVVHPGFHPGQLAPLERRPESTAFVEGNSQYYQGCFVGGAAESFLKMCETITHNIDIDDSNGIVAIWHDESHLNRYLIDNPPAKVLSTLFCYPQKYLPAIKIIHLDKGNIDRPGGLA